MNFSGELNIKHTCANSNVLTFEAAQDENHFYGLSLCGVWAIYLRLPKTTLETANIRKHRTFSL